MKNKNKILTLVLIFCFIFFINSSKFVYAVQDGILNFTIKYKDEAISGLELSIYQVADLSEDRDLYRVKSPFKYEGAFKDIRTTQDHLRLALEFERQSHLTKEFRKLNSDQEGKISFKGLEDGIYLVVQTGASKKASDYTRLQSFLVAVPEYRDGNWDYIVNAIPKTELKAKDKPSKPPESPPRTPPEKPKESYPKTGDDSHLSWWFLMLLLSVCLLGLTDKKKNKKMRGVIDEK